MAGQGRNADGVTGTHPPNAVNVVRFPGNWFGPLSDLVTVGTDADDARVDKDLFTGEPGDNAASSFWGEDAADDRRGGKAEGVVSPEAVAPTPQLSASRGSFGWQWATPIGCAAIAVVAVVGVLTSGANTTQPVRALHRPPARHAAVKPAVAPEVTIWLDRASSAGPVPGHRDKAVKARGASHVSRPRSPVPSTARRQPETVVVGVGAERLTATATTGDIDSPTGVVSPPPSTTQVNP